MAHPRILDAARAALVVIDIQEAFRDVIPDFPTLASRVSIAARGFQALNIPIIITEQYPKGLGRTAEEILLAFVETPEVIEKTAFSACGADAFRARLADLEVDQIVVCGIEAHICVSQTTHDLLDLGSDVHLLLDCISSRHDHDRAAGVEKMIASGAVPSSTEMALFELMRDSHHEQFRSIQALIK